MSFPITISPLAAYAKLASTSEYGFHGAGDDTCRSWLSKFHALFRQGGGGSNGLVALTRLDQAGNWMLLRVDQEPAPDSFGRAHESAVGGPVGMLAPAKAVSLLTSAFRSRSPGRDCWRHGLATVVDTVDEQPPSPTAQSAVADSAFALALGLVPWVRCPDAPSSLATTEAAGLESLDWLMVGSISAEALAALPSGQGIIITSTQLPAPVPSVTLAPLGARARADLLALSGLTRMQRLTLAETATGLRSMTEVDDRSLEWLFLHGGPALRAEVLHRMTCPAATSLLQLGALADEEFLQVLPLLPRTPEVASRLAALRRRDLFNHHFGSNHAAVEAFLSPLARRWWQHLLSGHSSPDESSETLPLDGSESAFEELDQNAMTERLPISMLGRMQFSRVLRAAFSRRLVGEGLPQPVAEALVFGTAPQRPPAPPAAPPPSADWISKLNPDYLANFGESVVAPAWRDWWLAAVPLNKKLAAQLGQHPADSLAGGWCVSRGWACSHAALSLSDGSLTFTLYALQWRLQAAPQLHPLLGRMIKNAGLSSDHLARGLRSPDETVRQDLRDGLCWLVAHVGIDFLDLITLVPEATSSLNAGVASEHWRGILSLDAPAVESVPPTELEDKDLPLLRALAVSTAWWQRWPEGAPLAWLAKLQPLLKGTAAEPRLQALIRAHEGALLTHAELQLAAPALAYVPAAAQVARRAAATVNEENDHCVTLALASPALSRQPELQAWLHQRCRDWLAPPADLPRDASLELMKALLPLLEPRETANWLVRNASSPVLAADSETHAALEQLARKGRPPASCSSAHLPTTRHD